MNETSRYDVIIIGTGAGGGTLAHRLAPSGKRILLLERGDYVPREKDNWSTRAVNVEGKYNTKEVVARRGRRAAPSPHQLLRRRQHQVLRRGAVPAAPGGLRGAQALRRDLARVADRLRGPGALLHARPSSSTTCTASGAKTRPTRPPARRTRTPPSATSRASSSSATTSSASGSGRSTCRSASCSTRRTPEEPLHPLRHLRRHPVPRLREGRRPGALRRSGARAPERRRS